MRRAFTREELEADIAFLVLRAGAAGSCSFSDDRWTGSSSNALVRLAYGGKQDCMPSDRSDYAACVRTYVRLPKHRQTLAIRAGLGKARKAYLNRYPEDATARSRNEARARRQAEWEARKQPKRRRRA